MRLTFLACLLALATPAMAADSKPPESAKGDAAKTDTTLPPLPADRTVAQSVVIAGKSLSYDVTVGTLPLFDAKGKKTGEVVYTAYVAKGGAAARPVTFAFNGGPGAASGFLNYGAIGPKRVQFGAQGDAPSDSAVARDNPNSWLDFTDLVFIDPIGTGYSRSLIEEAEAKKAFFTPDSDIAYLSRTVSDWLTKNGRMTSPKYLVGESYGGYRVPRLAYYLQSRLGVGLNGIVMVSPALSMTTLESDVATFSPMTYITSLPSMAAGRLEREGKLASPAALAEVEAYARGEYAVDLLRGRSDPQAIERMTARVSAFTGLDPKLVRQYEGRIDIRTFLRETHRDTASIGSIYDSNVTAFDPFPESPDNRANDPLLDAIMAPVTGAAVDLMTRTAGWKVEGRYNLLSYEVGNLWDRKNQDEAITDLRKAVAVDPKMAVLIAHGMDDLSCPYFVSRLVIDQMPGFGRPDRVQLALYPGGHMFYSRADSGAAFRKTALALYQR
ncbi:peptidase S10 [Sphingomonas sp. AP4-R1]|uniref:S10 family peptidase n=1 Tax=Sphingomonas sp. AP4-R1 TaxID=2735134 RepID=UPI001493B3D8|nr:peptidase S10 [Sphingomonas sp. AP4-R1]QJU57598.1 peptidase S10 [Sphingomonas sp. AP4-R1]